MRKRQRRRRSCRHRHASQARPEVPGTPPGEARGVSCLIGPIVAAGQNLGDLVYALFYWGRLYRREWGQRPPEYWFALLSLVVATIGVFVTYYAALHSAPSAAKVHFDTGIIESPDGGGPRSYATPKLHSTPNVRLRITPLHQDLGEVRIRIAVPESIELTPGCTFRVDDGKRHSCLEFDGEGRIEVGHLDSGQTLEVTAGARVVHRIESQEAILVEMSSADTEDPSEKRISLYSPKGSDGEEAAKANFRDEVRKGPLHWDEPTMQMREDVFEDLGDEWQLLDPRRAHSLTTVPYGRVVEVGSLINNRFLGPRIVTFRTVVRTTPLRTSSFRAGGTKARLFEEVFALGPPSRQRSLWCSTSRNAVQPRLHRGDHVLVRAALVGWGLARPFGQPIQAAMLICPVVRLADREPGAAATSSTGGVPAPSR